MGRNLLLAVVSYTHFHVPEFNYLHVQKRSAYKILYESLKERDHQETLNVDGDTIKMNLKKRQNLWTGFIWHRVGTSGSLL